LRRFDEFVERACGGIDLIKIFSGRPSFALVAKGLYIRASDEGHIGPTITVLLVCGTGDLSELALGWCTYGVGDHMSHYNVNASVAKTLIQHLIRFVATSSDVDEKTVQVLFKILATEISPELVPADGGLIQSTEKIVGSYDLQDFSLFYVTRYGFRPSKVAYLAHHAWSDPLRGTWPENIGPKSDTPMR
jgi:NAD+ synthase (glutamine-hydrolysing)